MIPKKYPTVVSGTVTAVTPNVSFTILVDGSGKNITLAQDILNTGTLKVGDKLILAFAFSTDPFQLVVPTPPTP